MHDTCPIALEDLELRGELARRSLLSFQRLEQYTPAYTLPGNANWPADREGRAVLAQVLIGRTVHRLSSQTDELLAGLPKGVIGPALDLTAIDEQQIAGHSWLLRGLCEHYSWLHRSEVLQRIRRIVDDLYLPLVGRYATYPIDPARRQPQGGGLAGEHLGGILDGWRLSSDIGAAFIALDGLTHAYEIDPRPELAVLIEEIVARFGELDPVAVGNQTHATLTCLRGLLRWNRLHQSPALVSRVQSLFASYLAIASTEHHQNWNWYGRPSWTEPCAVVDSLEVAVGLWRTTGCSGMLAVAQEILFTGLARQRHNGGYGCDICTGAEGQTSVKPHAIGYEAPWCCTMRGAEGLARAAESSWCTNGVRVLLPWQGDSTATLRVGSGTWIVQQASTYPLDGRSRFTVLSAPNDGRLELALYAAPWIDRGQVVGIDSWDGDWGICTLPARVGYALDVDLPLGLRQQPAVGSMRGTHSSLRHGPLLLGLVGRARTMAELGRPAPIGPGRYRVADGDVLAPLGDATWLPEAECKQMEFRALFAH